MALALGEARKDLSADALFRMLRSHSARFLIRGRPRSKISLGDALMSAFAMFSLKDTSLLAFDHRRRDPNDNFRTIYGINRVPSDSQMRDILDPLDPTDLRPVLSRDLPSPATRQDAPTLRLSRRPLPAVAGRHRLFLLLQDPLPLVPGEAPSRRRHHLFPSIAGSHPGPSRPQGSHPAGTRADHPAGWPDQE